MNTLQLHQVLTGELRQYLNITEIARVSGVSRQAFHYWMKNPESGSTISPQAGVVKLKLLCMQIRSSKTISKSIYNQWKKFLNMSVIAPEFCGCSSSSMSIYISRKGLGHYDKELKQIADLILQQLSPKDTVKKRKTVDLKIKIP